PGGARQDARELAQEVAIQVRVGGAALGASQKARAPGAQPGIGREVAAVKEVPRERPDLHAAKYRRQGRREGARLEDTSAARRGGASMPRLTRSFLTGEELDRGALLALLDDAAALKRGRAGGEGSGALAGRSVALVFEQPSTRTRVSLEVAVAELGGAPLVLHGDELQLTRGESVADTARVLSRYVHAIAVRARSHEAVAELASAASVPVVNALTPLHHPCQALADLLTLRERFGELEGLKLAYVGDGNNVARTLALLGRTAGVEVRVAAPEGYRLEPGLAALETADPAEAVAGADAIYTDVWVSMGDEAGAERRRADLAPYQVNAELVARASERAVVLHCLPAHPGEEIAEDVLYGERSAVWDQAENRLHTQKALLRLLLP